MRPRLQPGLRQRRPQSRPEAQVLDERPAQRLHVGGQSVRRRQALGRDRQLALADRQPDAGQKARPIPQHRQRIQLQSDGRQSRSSLQGGREGEELTGPLGLPRQGKRRHAGRSQSEHWQRRAQLLAGEQTGGGAIRARQPAEILAQILEQDDPAGGRDRLSEGLIRRRRARSIEDHIERDDRSAGRDQTLDQPGVHGTRPLADLLGQAQLLRQLPIQADDHRRGRRRPRAAHGEQPAEPEALLDRHADRRRGD